jgi:hypothetical protein
MEKLNMEIKTLMIGDLVYIRPWGADPTPNKITAISYNSWQGNDYADWVDCVEWDELSPNEIEPIPLTPEILKKNGFEYYHKNFASTDYDSPFKLEMVEWPDENGNGGLWLIKGLLKIRFVHELQDALRLCGIDKEIVL